MHNEDYQNSYKAYKAVSEGVAVMKDEGRIPSEEDIENALSCPWLMEMVEWLEVYHRAVSDELDLRCRHTQRFFFDSSECLACSP
jgi:hypothetical protein